MKDQIQATVTTYTVAVAMLGQGPNLHLSTAETLSIQLCHSGNSPKKIFFHQMFSIFTEKILKLVYPGQVTQS